jgi:hypothetical protein
MIVVIHSLLREEGANDDAGELKELVTECSMAIHRRGDQSAVPRELLVVAQRLLDAQLRLQDGGENTGRVVVSSSASDHQLMETAAAAKKNEKAAAAKKKKKRNKRNKAAAKHKGTKNRSWVVGGIISLLIMAVTFGSISTLSHIPQSHGSSEGNKAPPTLPPSSSTSLRQRDLQSGNNNMAPMSPASVSPFAALVQAPIFSPAVASNPPMNSVDERALLTCLDTSNWKDVNGARCTWYEKYDHRCPEYGSLYGGSMGPATEHCCYCGGGTCTDTPGWYDWSGYDCSWYKVRDDPGCPQYGSQTASAYSTAQRSANDNCCYCKNEAVHSCK